MPSQPYVARPGDAERASMPELIVLVREATHAAHTVADALDSLADPTQSPKRCLDEQIKDTFRAHGFDADILELLEAWIQYRTATQAAQMLAGTATLSSDRVVDRVAVRADPFEPLSAIQLGQRLGSVVPETIRLRERQGAVFSALPIGRERGRVYPAFQAWPEFAGSPLRQILQALGDPDGGSAWGFFDSTPPELDGLTPVEAVSGRLVVPRAIDTGDHALLNAPAQVRLDAVLAAAHAFAADRSA